MNDWDDWNRRLSVLSSEQREIFHNKMHPWALIKQAEEIYGTQSNWDRHIRFRHLQYIGRITSKIP